MKQEEIKQHSPGPDAGKDRMKKILLITLAVLLAAVLGIVCVWNLLLNRLGDSEKTVETLSQEELDAILGTTVPVETSPEDTWPVVVSDENITNIMLVGQNWREDEQNKLSDTMILCSINKETKTITLTSFLRDLYIQLPNYKGKICGENRINVCYNLGYKWAGDLGGMEMLDLLILNNFGVEVDYNVEIDFYALLALVNKLGGVTIDLDADEAKYLTDSLHCQGSFVEGENLILGDTALAYARMRKANAGDSDINRTARQRKLITQIIKQCMSMSLSELNDVLTYILPMILTDMNEEEIMDLAMIAIGMLTDLKIESNMCPAPGTYWGDIVNIGGYDSGVIKCNVFANKERLMAIAENGMSVAELDAAAEE